MINMTEPEKYFIELERHLTTLSLAVRLVDDYAPGGEPLEKVTVSVTGNGRSAIRNLSGYYLFNDLPVSTYEVLVESDFYLPEAVTVTTGNPNNLVTEVFLKPNSAYPFLSMATLIRGLVAGVGNEPQAGARVQAAAMVPDSSVKAKIDAAGAVAGDTGLQLVNISGPLVVGDRLMIRDANASRVEFCRIAAPLPANPGLDQYNLLLPLAFNHAGGTAVNALGTDSILDTRSTEKGEFVIYFNRTRAPRFITTVITSQTGYQNDERDVEVIEGSALPLGRIELVP